MKRLASSETWVQNRPTGTNTCSRHKVEASHVRESIGLDLHKVESQVCVLNEAGVIDERRMATSRERFSAMLGARSPARVLLENLDRTRNGWRSIGRAWARR